MMFLMPFKSIMMKLLRLSATLVDLVTPNSVVNEN